MKTIKVSDCRMHMDDNRKALERLYRRQTFGIKPGLDVIEALLKKLGNPERSFGVIHVAGTNGKGSVCAMLDSVLRVAGINTGLYTSPHLVSFNERICVGGKQVGDDELASLIEKIEGTAREVAREMKREPTFFECSTAMAFDYFRAKGVKLGVVEVGLGGRLDATNVVMPVVSVITRISLEHTVYLGNDVESIAFEKAGIVKPGRPVVCGAMDESAREVIKRIAKERSSSFFYAAENASVRVVSSDLSGQKVAVETANASYGTMKLPFVGLHQVENLSTAITALEVLGDVAGVVIEPDRVKAGIGAARWNGRFQVLSKDPPLIVDGAHNPDAARVLADALRQVLRGRPAGLIVGMCGDKDVSGFLKSFGAMVRRLWVVPVKSERNMPEEKIISAGKVQGWNVESTSLEKAVSDAECWAREVGGVICVAGSLFLAGEMLEMRGCRS